MNESAATVNVTSESSSSSFDADYYEAQCTLFLYHTNFYHHPWHLLEITPCIQNLNNHLTEEDF